jgi:hypothetical protein
MSNDDVHPNEMNAPHDFDDAATDALLSGGGRDVDPRLADLIGDMRVAYTSTPPAVGAELAALMAATPPAPAPSALSRRFESMRSSMLAKIGTATAAVVAATGGLAIAQALPAPVQDAVSHLGVGASSHHSADAEPADEESTTSTSSVDPSSTTLPAGPSSTTAPRDNHGGEVSAVARDHSDDGCNHGAKVSAVASDGRSNNEADPSCETSTSIADGSTTTTVKDDEGDSNETDKNPGEEHDATTPTSQHDNSGGDHGASGSTGHD